MVSGVFNSSDISDQKIIFTSIESARNLLKLKKEDVSALAIKIEKGYKPSSLAVKIKEILGENYSVKKRDELNETYYKMLNAEGLILNLVLGLILIVAMFNTVGAVIILIIEKQKNIKMFYKLGATKHQVNSVFFKHGLLLSYSGGFVGLALGCLIVFLQQSFGIILLTGTSIPYPVAFEFNNFLVVSTWLLAVGAGGSFLSSLALKKIKQ
jgi:lipoprotein-releasing system permease protein